MFNLLFLNKGNSKHYLIYIYIYGHIQNTRNQQKILQNQATHPNQIDIAKEDIHQFKNIT